MGLHKEYDNYGKELNLYKDDLSRETVTEIILMIDGIECYSNEVLYALDLVTSDAKVVYEIEYGHGWHGNRWINNPHKDLFGVGYFTLNVPDRKFYIWGGKGKYVPVRFEDIHLYDGIKVHYVRLNADHNQIVIVRDHVLRDPSKLELVEDKETKKSDRLEDWWVIHREDCETYNKQLDGTWVLETLPGGKYNPRTTRGAEMFRNLKNKK